MNQSGRGIERDWDVNTMIAVTMKTICSGIIAVAFCAPIGFAQTPFQVQATAAPVDGPIPLKVQFSSSGSTGDGLRFEWYFSSDLIVGSTSPEASHTYSTPGNYPAQLRVYNSKGDREVRNFTIHAGNSAPIVKLSEPPDGAFFKWGQWIAFKVSVSDKEDGSTEAGTIPCSSLQGETALFHNDHAHGFKQFQGCQGTFQASDDSMNTEAQQGQDMRWLFNASYVDRGAAPVDAITGFAGVILQPMRKQAEHFSNSSGILLDSNGGDENAIGQKSAVAIGSIGKGDWISFKPMNLKNIKSLSCHAASTLGGKIEARIDSATGPLVGTVVIGTTGGAHLFADFHADLTDPGGTHEIFFVFQGQQGSQNLFGLDYLEFQGQGISLAIRKTKSLVGARNPDKMHPGFNVKVQHLDGKLPKELVCAHEKRVSAFGSRGT